MLISGTLDEVLDIHIFIIVANYMSKNLEVHLEVGWISIVYILYCLKYV